MPGALENPPPSHDVEVTKELWVPMRDGVRLAADLYVPKDNVGALPTILISTPYSKERASYVNDARYFAGHGFAVVVEDFRGRFKSEGEFRFTRSHREDGYDTFAWIVKQPWSTGKIGTYGCSYAGEVQLYQAPSMPPGLTAMIPQAAGGATGSAGKYFHNAMDLGGGAWGLSIGFDWWYRFGSQVFYGPRQTTAITDDNRADVEAVFNAGPIVPQIEYGPILNTLPILDMMKRAKALPNEWADFVAHNIDLTDPWWSKFNFVKEGEMIPAPSLFIESWNDWTGGATLYLRNMFERTATTEEARRNQFVIVSPASHCQSEKMGQNQFIGDQFVGDPRFGQYDIYLKWFRHWLNGDQNAVTSMPKVQYYVLGANRWQASNAWPIPGTRMTKYFLTSAGRANSHFGDGRLVLTAPATISRDEITYDPMSPTPSVGANDYMGTKPISDQRSLSAREDVLVYTSDALTNGFEMTGEPEVTLYVQSSARDTDFIAKLVDVYPDGTAFNIRENILRARYRNGRDKPAALMKPGEVYVLTFRLGAYSTYFFPGHRIRLQVTSSAFPRYDRNLNTGGNNFDETAGVVARNMVLHGNRYPSHITLPVVPE
jgi:putative CocE/NonD family hydrolase